MFPKVNQAFCSFMEHNVVIIVVFLQSFVQRGERVGRYSIGIIVDNVRIHYMDDVVINFIVEVQQID